MASFSTPPFDSHLVNDSKVVEIYGENCSQLELKKKKKKEKDLAIANESFDSFSYALNLICILINNNT